MEALLDGPFNENEDDAVEGSIEPPPYFHKTGHAALPMHLQLSMSPQQRKPLQPALELPSPEQQRTERIPKKPQQQQQSRSLVDVLLAGKESAGSRIAAVLADAERLVAEFDTPHGPDRNLLPRQDMTNVSSPRNYAKIGEAAVDVEATISDPLKPFAVLGKRRRNPTEGAIRQTTFDFDDQRFARMRIRQCPLSHDAFAARWDGHVVVDIADLADDPNTYNSGKLGERVVFGCLAKKHEKKLAKNGRMYAVWTLTNMASGDFSVRRLQVEREEKRFTAVLCLVFGDAFEAFHTQVEGAVFAMRNPTILPPRLSESIGHGDEIELVGKVPSTVVDRASIAQLGRTSGLSRQHGNTAADIDYPIRNSKVPNGQGNRAGVALKISNAADVIYVGVCADFGTCGKQLRDGSQCGSWFNAKIGVICPKHAADLLRKRVSSIRMDVNNQERPGVTRDSLLGTRGPVDISRGDDLYRTQLSVLEMDAARDRLGRDKISALKDRSRAKSLRNEALRIAHSRLPQHSHVERPMLLGNDQKLAQNACMSSSKGITLRALMSKDRHQRSAKPNDAKPVYSAVSTAPLLSRLGSSQMTTDYRNAVSHLLQLGFRLNELGGLEAPPEVALRRLGIPLIRSVGIVNDEGSDEQIDDHQSKRAENKFGSELPDSISALGVSTYSATAMAGSSAAEVEIELSDDSDS